MLNQVNLIGRLGADPEVRNTNDGKKVVSISVATSERWKDRDGEKQERTEWHRVVVFEPAANFVADYCNKGDLVYILGKIQTRKWEDKDGNDKYTTEIVVGGFGGAVTKLSYDDKGGGRGRDRDDDDGGGRGRSSDRGRGGSDRGSGRRSGGGDDLDDDSSSRRGGGSTRGGGGRNRSSQGDLDDDIPF